MPPLAECRQRIVPGKGDGKDTTEAACAPQAMAALRNTALALVLHMVDRGPRYR